MQESRLEDPVPFCPLIEAGFELLKRSDDEEWILKMPDVVGLAGHPGRLEREFLHLVRQAVLRLRVTRDDAVTVDAQSTGILDQSKFNREPVDARESFLDR